MFGLGIQEMLLVAFLAVVILGPKHLPQAAKTLGSWMIQLKRTSNQLRDSFHQEVEELQKDNPLKDFQEDIQATWRDIDEEVTSAAKEEKEEEPKKKPEETFHSKPKEEDSA